MTGKRPVDPNWDARPGRVWQQYELHVQRLDMHSTRAWSSFTRMPMEKGLWKGTSVHDRAEYFTAGVLAYFDAAGQDMPPNDAPHGDHDSRGAQAVRPGAVRTRQPDDGL